jgi:hypothetical protein
MKIYGSTIKNNSYLSTNVEEKSKVKKIIFENVAQKNKLQKLVSLVISKLNTDSILDLRTFMIIKEN